MRGNGKRENDESKESSTNEVAEHTNMAAMQEYEIFLPPPLTLDARRGCQNPGNRRHIGQAFGSYAHLNYRSEDARRMGDVSFHDEVTIVRVLDDGSAHFDMTAFQKSIETALPQEAVLIISRQVAAL